MERGEFYPNPYAQSSPFSPQNASISPIQSPGFYRTRGPWRDNQGPPANNWRGFGGSNQRHGSPRGYGQQSPYYSPNNSTHMTSYSSTPSSHYESFNDSNGGPQSARNSGSFSNSPGQGWSQRGGSPGNYQGRFQHNQRKWSGNFGQQGGQRGGNRGNFHSHSSSIRDYVSPKCCEDPWKDLYTTPVTTTTQQSGASLEKEEMSTE